MSPKLTPAQALKDLLAGNQRFVSGEVKHPNQDAQRRADLASGQNPFATLFGCGDSRLAAEVIFDQGLGDMFVVRTAGHVVESAVLGSIEYAVVELGTPLVVVLGHDSCGAVTAAKDSLEKGELPGGYIRNLVEPILPSVIAPHLPEDASVNDMVREHTRQTSARILEQSHLIAQAVKDNRTAVLGMFYHLAEGEVEIVFASENLADQV
ncbi:carbonic anhydrase [Rothia amarae]|uniref:Carbonic anhydrase n=1 Tax=Rothia amarae TaxID=169480 RepID=A0A7H2BIJ1_9MICC|nr:carbonic anhydrase [Rothia amarae]QNV39487.1 carbonic anhydrase [Rothia amarae]